MGLLDTLLGRTKPVRPNLDALFALPSAALNLDAAEGIIASGHAGVCWKPPSGRSPTDVQAEIAQLLDLPDQAGDPVAADADDTPTAEAGSPPAPGGGVAGHMTQTTDSFGYSWLLLDDADLERLVTRVHLVNSSLSDNGWGPQLLCSVFSMVPAAGGGGARPFFLVYLFKRGTFYPFAPTGKEKRDQEYELHLRSVLGSDLPVEPDLSRWFPLWDLPVP